MLISEEEKIQGFIFEHQIPGWCQVGVGEETCKIRLVSIVVKGSVGSIRDNVDG